MYHGGVPNQMSHLVHFLCTCENFTAKNLQLSSIEILWWTPDKNNVEIWNEVKHKYYLDLYNS
jgi:hypothetical protein